jgi:magnesium transporter
MQAASTIAVSVAKPNEDRAFAWDTAAGHIVADVPVARGDTTVADTIAMLRERRFAAVEVVFVVDARQRLSGAVTIDALLGAADTCRLAELVDTQYPRVREDEDQEHVASAALARPAVSVAVVDRDERMIGAVPVRALLAILRQEHVEDLHRLAGIKREAATSREALEGPPVRRARHRLPWLLFGLGGSIAAALLMSGFERVLERDLAIAFFVPAIVYLADAIGTQTETIAVRGLSISRLTIRHLLATELRTGLLIGSTLAALSFPLVLIGFGSTRLALAVALAILIAGSVATTVGLLLPWLLQRSGRDPAFGSGPVATIIQDVASLLIYFVLATIVMNW